MKDKVLGLLRNRRDLDALEICKELSIGMQQLRNIVNDLNKNNDNLFIEEYHVYKLTDVTDINAPKILFVLQENDNGSS